MIKKIFTAIIIIAILVMTVNNNMSIATIPNEEEIEEYQVLEKTLSCMSEVSKFGQTMKLQNNYNYFTQTQNKLTKTFNKFINFFMFPINLGMNLLNCGFNCLAILADWDYRTEILINWNWVDNDFTSGSSYGGGGGGFSGGR